MPKLSRFLLGGAVGAGLALLFAPKPGRELRRMLMGGGRRMLPSPETESVDIPPTIDRASLESRIEETRQQLATQLGQEEAAGAAEEEAKEELEAVAQAAEEEDFVVEEAPPEAQTREREAAETGAAGAGEAASAEPWEEEIAALKTPAAGEPDHEGTVKKEEPVKEEEHSAEAPANALPEPSGFDQEEMRRRIDATRARLKAKAFDTMVSGETFIETEADKAAKTEKPAGPRLEEDIEKQIDESLKEQD